MPNVDLLINFLNNFSWLGNWLFFLLAFVESAPFMGLFVPGATLVSVGGFLSSQHYLNAWNIILFASLGAIVGDFTSYGMGRWGGDWVKRKKIIKPSILRLGENFFNKYGSRSVFFGRFFGPVRAIIPFVAGMAKMKKRQFVFCNILSGIAWAALNVFLGYFSGTLIVSIFKKWSGTLGIILASILVILIIYWLLKKRGESMVKYFKANSVKFVLSIQEYDWFKKLTLRYPVIEIFLSEAKHAKEKLFGSVLIFTFLLVTYLLIIILDVF